MDKLKVGSMIHNKGFISTTLDQKLSLSFAPATSVIHLTIKIPAGVKMLILHKSYNTSSYNQCEFLLPLNSVFRVDSKSVTKTKLNGTNRKRTNTSLGVTLVGFNTPTIEQLTNMYNDYDDKLYNSILNALAKLLEVDNTAVEDYNRTEVDIWVNAVIDLNNFAQFINNKHGINCKGRGQSLTIYQPIEKQAVLNYYKEYVN